MDGTLGVLELEIRLGFNFSRGLSRAKGVRDHPVLSRLLSGLDTINSRFVSYSTKRIRTSEAIKREAQALFQQLGPSLWPNPSEPRPYWLFDSPVNEHETAAHRLYPRNLYYSKSDDRDVLWQHFCNLVRGKILRYHWNHTKNLPQAWEPSDSDCLPNSQESEGPGDSDDIDWLTEYEKETDKDPDYVATTPRRKRTRDNNPQSSGGNAMTQFPAPTAPMRPESPSMGNTQTKLDGLRAENRKEPEMSPSLGQSNHVDNTPLPSEGAVNASLGNSFEEPGASSLKVATSLGKRPAAQENVGAKKPKLNNEVIAPKPSLLVCLKLTPGKLAKSTNNAYDSQRKVRPGGKALHGSSHSATAAPDSSKVVRGGPKNLMSRTQCGFTPSTQQETQKIMRNPGSTETPAIHMASSSASQPQRSKNPSQTQTPVPNSTVDETPAPTPSSAANTIPRNNLNSLHGLEWLTEARRQAAANESPKTSLAEGGPPGPQHSAPFTHESIPPHNSNAAQRIHQGDTAASNPSDPNEGVQDLARQPSIDTRNPQMDNADDRGPDDMPAQHKEEATSAAATTVRESSEVNNFLTKRMLHLYLQGQEESVGVVDLVKAKTHEKLFASIKNTIADEIDDSDTIVAVSISREDEEPIEGTKKQKIPIKKNGDPSIWEALVTFIAKNGAGEGGLMGLVRVKKVGDAKGN